MEAILTDQPLSALTVADLQDLIRATVKEALRESLDILEPGQAREREYVRSELRFHALREISLPLGSEDRIPAQRLQLTAVIEPEGDGYVATCPEVDVVSQGQTVEEARWNLMEAVEGFLEVASPSEIRRRARGLWSTRSKGEWHSRRKPRPVTGRSGAGGAGGFVHS